MNKTKKTVSSAILVLGAVLVLLSVLAADMNNVMYGIGLVLCQIGAAMLGEQDSHGRPPVT